MPREPAPAPRKRAQAKPTDPKETSQPRKRAAPAKKTQADAPSDADGFQGIRAQGLRSNKQSKDVSAPRKLTPKQKNEQLKQKLQQLLDEM